MSPASPQPQGRPSPDRIRAGEAPFERSQATVCQAVRAMTAEFFVVYCGGVGPRRERRRFTCHVRQIAMYVCHVSLRMTMTAVGNGFGRDRSTVAYACAVIEDRRDDRHFDEFVAAMERIAVLAFGRMEGPIDE